MDKPLIDDEGEVRELTLEDFKQMRPIREIHPDMPMRIGAPPSVLAKVPISLRLDQEVVEYFKSFGEGWQSRLNAVLCDYVVTHRQG